MDGLRKSGGEDLLFKKYVSLQKVNTVWTVLAYVLASGFNRVIIVRINLGVFGGGIIIIIIPYRLLSGVVSRENGWLRIVDGDIVEIVENVFVSGTEIRGVINAVINVGFHFFECWFAGGFFYQRG